MQTFFGIEVVPGRLAAIMPLPFDARLHLSRVTLSLDAKSGERVGVTAKVDKEPHVLICSLKEGTSESESLDLIFDSYVELKVIGNASVHITGYYMLEHAPGQKLSPPLEGPKTQGTGRESRPPPASPLQTGTPLQIDILSPEFYPTGEYPIFVAGSVKRVPPGGGAQKRRVWTDKDALLIGPSGEPFVSGGVRRSTSAEANNAEELETDYEIWERAIQDISTVKDVLSSRKPRASLLQTSHLRAAYEQYMRKIRVVNKMKRPWEKYPQCKSLFLDALYIFSQMVEYYSESKKIDESAARIFPIGWQADLDVRTLCGAVAPSEEDMREYALRYGEEDRAAINPHPAMLEVALQDISRIQRVLSWEDPPEALREATHLLETYRVFMTEMREHDLPRPWEKSPHTQEYIRRLHLFCGCVEEYRKVKEATPENAERFQISWQVDID